MIRNSIPQKPIIDQAPLIHVKKMSSQEFWGRIAKNSRVRVEHRPGQIIVYRGDQRVARWMPYPQVLHYIPETTDPPEVTDEAWPPTCPDCGGPMVVKFGGEPRSPFWSCKKFDGPWPRPCIGRMPFTLHPDDLAEYTEFDPVHWRELTCKSLARLEVPGLDEAEQASDAMIVVEV